MVVTSENQCRYVKRNGSGGCLYCRHIVDHEGDHEDGYDGLQLTPQSEWMPFAEWEDKYRNKQLTYSTRGKMVIP